MTAPSFGGGLSSNDYTRLGERWITRELADAAMLRRVDSLTGRDIVGRHSGDFSGVAIPYMQDGHAVEYRIRRDNPDLVIRAGGVKEEQKYAHPVGRGSRIYYPPMAPADLLTRVDVPLLIVEGEFKALASWRLSTHETTEPRFLPIALAGVWNFWGSRGKAQGPKAGQRLDVKGVIADFDKLGFADRRVIIAFDADVREKEQVRAARSRLAFELRGRGAKVAFLEWDASAGKGLDDHIVTAGPDTVLAEIAALNFDDWRANLLQTKEGRRLPVVENALIALRHAPEWTDVLSFDQSALKAVVKNNPPWEEARTTPFAWTDADDVRTAAWLQRRGIMISTRTAAEAVHTVAGERSFHPIQDYLNSLTWDGILRIGDFFGIYAGANSTEYTRAVGRKWLIAGVARILQSGCKVDTAVILEGPQGSLKSTFFRKLAEPWFSDSMAELGTKDAVLQMRGKWLIELAELDAMTRGEVNRIKAFMSIPSDHLRLPFGRWPVDLPRESFFCGTVNENTYLKDATGGRRWWPVKCGAIRIEELVADRNQIWAEAVHCYKHGEKWWIDDPEINAAAASEQAERYDSHPWTDPIIEWLAGRDEVSVPQILELCLGKAKEHWTQQDQNQVARILVHAGWQRFYARVGKAREWRYRRLA